MSPRTGRWLAPLGASSAVLAVLLVPGAVAVGGGETGVGPQRPDGPLTPHDPVTPVLPPDGSDGVDASRADPRHVDVLAYRSQGRTLHVYYRVDQHAGCSGAIEEPVVEERASSVQVLIRRRPVRGDDQVCAYRVPTSSVEIRLSRPLGARLLRDASRSGSLVPPVASQP
jgi:hypothetical protein